MRKRAKTYGDLEGLGGKADGALGAEVLGLGALNELGADLLERGDLARGEGDADLVDLLERTVSQSVGSAAGDGSGRERTGASPKSFSGLLYDILAVGWVEKDRLTDC